MDRRQLRQQIRQRRRALSIGQQNLASYHWCRLASGLNDLRFRRHIGAYLAFDGEIQLQRWIELAWQRGQKVFLPVLHPLVPHKVWFVRFQPNSRLRKNRFGILEPDPRYNQRLPAWSLSTICLPLVAFDCQGNRLGMGGGFYDRLLDELRRKGRYPATIGCAHGLQQVEKLDAADWDQPIDFIVTDQEVIECKHQAVLSRRGR